MSLKTATLLAAITMSLATLGGIVGYVNAFAKLKWADNAAFFVTNGMYLVANIMLVVFLFTLVARQKAN